MYELIINRFIEFNIGVPSIIFWNLSQNDTICNLPCLYNQPNTMLLSGYSSILLNYLSLIDKQLTPYDSICSILNNSRYDIFGNYLIKLLSM